MTCKLLDKNQNVLVSDNFKLLAWRYRILRWAILVVSALILGEFAVKARWFVPEVLLYMAFVAVANFATPSFELGYALKLCRMMLVVLIALVNIWGFAVGCILIIIASATTKTLTGQGYLTPLSPFNASKLARLIVRRRMSEDNT